MESIKYEREKKSIIFRYHPMVVSSLSRGNTLTHSLKRFLLLSTKKRNPWKASVLIELSYTHRSKYFIIKKHIPWKSSTKSKNNYWSL